MNKRSKKNQKQNAILHSQKINSDSECPFFEDCNIRLGVTERQDNTWALVHLTVRLIYTIMAWAFLAKGISTTFFVSLFLFVVPVLMDCAQFGLEGWSRRGIIKYETLVCLLWTVFAFLGLIGMFVISVEDGLYLVKTASDILMPDLYLFNVRSVWMALGTVPLITIIDFASRCIDKQAIMKAERTAKNHVK